MGWYPDYPPQYYGGGMPPVQSGQDPIKTAKAWIKFLKKEEEAKKKEGKDKKDDPPFFLFGYEIKKRKKESTGSLLLWLMLGLLAFSPYVDILQQWMEKSLRAALQ